MSSQLVDKVKSAGVVGAGGGGFPTWAKINNRAEVIIVNGAECEPLLRVDQQLVKRYARELMAALTEIRAATGAEKAFVALKEKYGDARVALDAAAEDFAGIELFLLGDVYPAGDEHLLVFAVTGRRVQPGGLPLSVGVVVLNVETVLNVYWAMQGRPVTHKYLTIAGAVKKPQTLRVPLGMSIGELIKLAGGATTPEFRVIKGGPCMGQLATLDEPVVKTTKGIVVLPAEHPVARRLGLSFSVNLVRALAVCGQCQQCTDLCPRYLLGHPVLPHRTMRAASYSLADAAAVGGALLCSECGVCDLYACSFGLSPREVNRAIKREIARLGVKPFAGWPRTDPPKERTWRHIPTGRLLTRLDLLQYDASAELIERRIRAKEVRLPLKQHAGVPAEAMVRVGERVTVGQLVASMPATAIGANIHASIDGEVLSTSPVITIRG